MDAAVYARILVPLDGSARAERVLPYVQPLAATFGAVVTLLHATAPPAVPIAAAGMPAAVAVAPVLGPGPTGAAAGGPPEGAGHLEAVADRLRASGLTVELEMPEGPAAAAIVAVAEQTGADLIAMTTHGRGGLGRLVMGSVADEVLRHAPCPVLLVRVGEEPA
jgi:nucleotide-binding universal stress UspA family protein